MKLAIAQPELSPIDRLFTTARRADLADGLVEMAIFVTGVAGFLSHQGHSMRVVGSALPMIDLSGDVVHGDTVTVPDPMLAALGVEWAYCANVMAPLDRRGAIGVLVFRAGILAKALDRAFHHLEKRESGGQKTLQHQLVKASFVECFEQIEQIRLESVSLLNDAIEVDIVGLHSGLSIATVKAAKLMGGHGFLLGEVNSLEIFSLCIAAIYGRADASGQIVDFSQRKVGDRLK